MSRCRRLGEDHCRRLCDALDDAVTGLEYDHLENLARDTLRNVRYRARIVGADKTRRRWLNRGHFLEAALERAQWRLFGMQLELFDEPPPIELLEPLIHLPGPRIEVFDLSTYGEPK